MCFVYPAAKNRNKGRNEEIKEDKGVRGWSAVGPGRDTKLLVNKPGIGDSRVYLNAGVIKSPGSQFTLYLTLDFRHGEHLSSPERQAGLSLECRAFPFIPSGMSEQGNLVACLCTESCEALAEMYRLRKVGSLDFRSPTHLSDWHCADRSRQHIPRKY
ncbi:hypothetical protein VTI74DRAFT_8103 [Chaetomium olivicolor]